MDAVVAFPASFLFGEDAFASEVLPSPHITSIFRFSFSYQDPSGLRRKKKKKPSNLALCLWPSAKANAYLDLPHVWKGMNKERNGGSQHVAGGVFYTNPERYHLPL